MLAIVENTRRKQLAWVQAVLEHRGWNASRLAKEGGFSHATLSKFKNDPNATAQLQTSIVEAIARVGGIPPYQVAAPQLPRGFHEDEAEPYEALVANPDLALGRAILAFRGGKNAIDPWVMRSSALELAGYLPGDILLVDMNETPSSGDAVCAQIYDRHGRAETVIRIYEHPYLVAASATPGLRRPVLIDNENVVVRGCVVATIRPRANAH